MYSFKKSLATAFAASFVFCVVGFGVCTLTSTTTPSSIGGWLLVACGVTIGCLMIFIALIIARLSGASEPCPPSVLSTKQTYSLIFQAQVGSVWLAMIQNTESGDVHLIEFSEELSLRVDVPFEVTDFVRFLDKDELLCQQGEDEIVIETQ